MYGNPKFEERRFLWDRLLTLHIGNGPCICIGDFNEFFVKMKRLEVSPTVRAR